jgi:excisionase family DNA binding protein
MDLREAAEALGVHYQTAYAWARDGTLPARKAGRGYEVSDAGVQALAARRRQGYEPRWAIRVRDWAAQAQALYTAITGGEETRARHQVRRLVSGVHIVDLCEQVIAPALRRVGDEWAAGRVSIAQEHRASAICERLLASQIRQPAGRPRGTAVVAAPPGERHGETRRYSRRDIDRLQEICALTADGLNLAGIRRVLELQEETRQLQAELARLRALTRASEEAPAAPAREPRARRAASE